jgi:hypothetical protein
LDKLRAIRIDRVDLDVAGCLDVDGTNAFESDLAVLTRKSGLSGFAYHNQRRHAREHHR